MNRRDFLKFIPSAAALVGIVWCLAEDEETVEFVEYDVDENVLRKSITVEGMTKEGIQCSIDTELLWKAISVYDSTGAEWKTEDGERWACEARGLYFDAAA